MTFTPFLNSSIGTILLFFSLQAPASNMRTAPSVANTQSTPREFPQPNLAFQSKYCRIEYTADKESDARELAKDADDGIDQMLRDLLPLDSHLMDNFDCTITQFAAPQPGLATDAQTNTHSEDGGRIFRVSILARSSISPLSRTLVGESKDQDYVFKNITDELSTPLFERLTRGKGTGWYFHSAPEWFVQGIEGYFGLTHSSAHSRDTTLPKYVALVRSHPDELVVANDLRVQNPYVGGLVFIAFLYDTYGASRINALLMSSRPTFSEAFGENFGDFGMIKQRYYAWIDKQRDLPSDH